MTRLAADIHEANRPIYCSACFNSQPIRHVDFDASCDRGYGKAEAPQVAMDDLILCENCMLEGLQVLGIQDSKKVNADNEELRRQLDMKDKLLRQQQKYLDLLEDVVSARGGQIDHRKKPRPLRTGVPA